MRIITIWGSLAAFVFTVASASAQTPGNKYQSYNFQYSTAAVGGGSASTPVSAFSAENPPKWFTLSITGTASTPNVVLEGSLIGSGDNTNWSTIAVTTSYTGTVSNALPYPMLYFRMRNVSSNSNTYITATAIGVW